MRGLVWLDTKNKTMALKKKPAVCGRAKASLAHAVWLPPFDFIPLTVMLVN
jgi:hypothetical protein